MKIRPALTLIELMLVTGLIAVLAGIGIVTFSGVQDKQALYASADTLKNVLTMAHVYASNSKDEKAWGVVYLDNKTYQLIKGSHLGYDVDSVYKVNAPIVIGNGNFEIWFDLTTGWTNIPYNIILRDPNGDTIKVRVNTTGVVEVQN